MFLVELGGTCPPCPPPPPHTPMVIAEHNLPLSLADDLVKFIRSLFPLNQTLRNVMLGKQKATNVVRQVLGFDYLQEAISALRSHSYSLIIDETTDLSTAKQLAVLTTYFDMQSLEYKSFLLDMPEIVDGTAEGIYSAVKHVFAELHIPMEKNSWLLLRYHQCYFWRIQLRLSALNVRVPKRLFC